MQLGVHPCRHICLRVYVTSAAPIDGWLLRCIGPSDWPADALQQLNVSYPKVCQLTDTKIGAALLRALADVKARISVGFDPGIGFW